MTIFDDRFRFNSEKLIVEGKSFSLLIILSANLERKKMKRGSIWGAFDIYVREIASKCS